MSEHTVRLGVEAAYDRWSAIYDAYDNPMVETAGHALSALRPFWQGRRVFEFGCGTGRNLAAMAAGGAARIGGCDLSEGMLARARDRLGATAALRRHDLGAPLGESPGAWDAGLFCLVLEHVADPVPVLADAARLVGPGGHVLVIEIHPFLAEGGTAAHFRDDGGLVEMPTFAHRFDGLLNAFSSAGLVLAHCREWRARDVPEPRSPKVGKRGPDHPIAVAFALSAR